MDPAEERFGREIIICCCFLLHYLDGRYRFFKPCYFCSFISRLCRLPVPVIPGYTSWQSISSASHGSSESIVSEPIHHLTTAKVVVPCAVRFFFPKKTSAITPLAEWRDVFHEHPYLKWALFVPTCVALVALMSVDIGVWTAPERIHYKRRLPTFCYAWLVEDAGDDRGAGLPKPLVCPRGFVTTKIK